MPTFALGYTAVPFHVALRPACCVGSICRLFLFVVLSFCLSCHVMFAERARYLCCTLDAHLHEQRRAIRGVRAAVVRRLGRAAEGGASGGTVLASSLKVEQSSPL